MMYCVLSSSSRPSCGYHGRNRLVMTALCESFSPRQVDMLWKSVTYDSLVRLLLEAS
jgi:hypothetical protein